MRRAALVLALCAFSLLGRDAAADVASEARFFDEAGRRAYKAGDFPKALESFQLLQEIAPSVGVLYNIALCADLAGRGDMAFSLYGEYLKHDDPDGERRAEAERRVERLKAKLALVQVATDPPGAVVYVDRKELGQFGETPVTLALSEGEHHLFVERTGYRPAELPVTVRAGTLPELHAALTPLFGRLVVNVTPGTTKLRFSRDGVALEPERERGGYRLQVGTYTVLASAPSYAPVERQVVVAEDRTSQLDLGLAPLPRPTGVLLVSTRAVSAELFVDGRRVAVTPARLGEVPVGRHLIEVRAGAQSTRRSVTIAQGKPTYVELELAEAR